MKRKTILSLAFSLGAFFLLLQLYLWNNVNEEDGGAFDKVTLGQFIKFNRNHGLPIFLIDVPTLSNLFNKSLRLNCRILCPGSAKIISFGLDSRFLGKEVESFADAAKEEIGTVVHCYNGHTPSVFGSKDTVPVPVHCYFEKEGLTVDLVIFYEIDSHFWWHGAVEKKWMNNYGQHEGAFDRISTKKVVIEGLQLRIPSNPNKFLYDVVHSTFIPCNDTSVNEFKSKYGIQTVQADQQYFTLKAVQLIRQAKEALDQLEIPFWLSSGTCLGWYRQCDIIPYSKDVDFGIFIKDYKVSLIPSMQKAGLKLLHKFGKLTDSFELSFQADKIKLDIFFFYEEKNYTWNGGTQTRTGNKYKYIFPPFSLCWTYFFQMKLRIPCQIQEYIEANYGKQWFQPVEHWDWKASPPNVKQNGFWSKEEWSEVINIYL